VDLFFLPEHLVNIEKMSDFTRFPDGSYSVMKKPSKRVLLFRLTNASFRFIRRVGNFRLLSLVDKSLRSVVIALIGGYQRYLSPIKGYSCTHRIVYGGVSCSEYVKNTLTDKSLFESTLLARQRFRACGIAYTSYKSRVIPHETCDPEMIAACCGAVGICGIIERIGRKG
jgi:putative component of membrane protein insertase Oxa1/YidC/SpoIIIJ protein YidD